VKPEELSLPALAIYTELRDRGELISEERFSEEFPDADYDGIIESLKNEGLYPEPAGIFRNEQPKGVLFKNKSAYSLRVF